MLNNEKYYAISIVAVVSRSLSVCTEALNEFKVNSFGNFDFLNTSKGYGLVHRKNISIKMDVRGKLHSTFNAIYAVIGNTSDIDHTWELVEAARLLAFYTIFIVIKVLPMITHTAPLSIF